MCLRKFEAMSYCLSINFNRPLLECELNDWKKNDTNDLVEDGNYFYVETVVSRMNICTVVCLKMCYVLTKNRLIFVKIVSVRNLFTKSNILYSKNDIQILECVV